MKGLQINIKGQVQGVGFRPKVWKLAREMGFTGSVRNTGVGVEVIVWGKGYDDFIKRMLDELPTAARIDELEKKWIESPPLETFEIIESVLKGRSAEITPDQGVCQECLDEINDPFDRRYRYPFNSCVDCGPRFSIIETAPYDRVRTTMKGFPLCEECLQEYTDPQNRRFHAQTIACYRCGPKAWLEKLDKGTVDYQAYSMTDSVDAAAELIRRGFIVAVKGIGGFNLMAAVREEVVSVLRVRKCRPSKPFALMARDLEVIKNYCQVSREEESLLRSPAAPIVLLKSRVDLPGVSPGLDRLGFMLPYTPLHHLLMRKMMEPVIMTSGNISGFTQCVSNEEVREKLKGVADFALMHDRDIAHQVDDSVVAVCSGKPLMIRRARGLVPSPLPLPEDLKGEGFLAMGGHLKNTFALVKDNRVFLSQHLGDLEEYSTTENYCRQLDFFREVYRFTPQLIVLDKHRDYFSSQEGRRRAEGMAEVMEVQHHHAHLVSCLMEHRRSLGPEERVLGIALDGSGLGDDGTIWGGEFLLFNYRDYQRVGCFKPVPLLGGEIAIKQPWRVLYAHLRAEMRWEEMEINYGELEVIRKLRDPGLPIDTLEAMLTTGQHAPTTTSCGRLFDAAAALVGLVWERQDYEGQAAMLLESVLDEGSLGEPDDLIYPFRTPQLKSGLPYIEPLSVWQAMLGDIILNTSMGTISARFHRGLARVIIRLALRLAKENRVSEVVLSGGCFQNRMLIHLITEGLTQAGLGVFSHSKIPPNDGGLSLGQVGVALARWNEVNRIQIQQEETCV